MHEQVLLHEGIFRVQLVRLEYRSGTHLALLLILSISKYVQMDPQVSFAGVEDDRLFDIV